MDVADENVMNVLQATGQWNFVIVRVRGLKGSGCSHDFIKWHFTENDTHAGKLS